MRRIGAPRRRARHSTRLHAAFATRVSSAPMTTPAHRRDAAALARPAAAAARCPRPGSSAGASWRATSAPASCACWCVAVTLAVAALTAVGFFADRLNGGLARDARQLLGGDAIVASDQPAPPTFAAQGARARPRDGDDRRLSRAWAARPTTKGGATRLVGVKAVSDALSAARPAAAAATAPRREARRRRRGAGAGHGLGRRRAARCARPARRRPAAARRREPADRRSIIVIEPDRGAGFASFAPRVMLNEADLAATGLIQPASRVTLPPGGRRADRARGGGAPSSSTGPRRRSRRKALRGLRVESLATGRPEMRQTLDRAEKFLNLVALLAALLARGGGGHRRRATSPAATSTTARCCACSACRSARSRCSTSSSSPLVGLLASVAGVLLGFAVHYVFVWLLAGLVDAALPAAERCGRRCSASASA